MKSLQTILVLALACATLAACGGIREDLGLGRSPPDEFAVVDRPPLAIPPDFGLRPPTPGAPRPQEVDPSIHASTTLFGGKSYPVAGGKSQAEKQLLEQSGADKASDDIRATLNNESTAVGASPHLVEELLWWKNDTKPGTTVDAAAEAERIKQAQEKGEALNKSPTPIIERDKPGWLGL